MTDPKDTQYNGQNQEQPVTITDKDTGKPLVEGTDFDISYSEDVKNVGEVMVTITGKGNYTGTITRTYNITPAAVTVKADDKSKTQGSRDPELTATVSGLVNGESVNLITYTLAREAGEAVRTYTITPSGVTTQGNYTVTFQNGTFTIESSGGGGTPIDDPDVPLDLTTDHYAYVEGYEDGTVKPEGKITRAETATMIYRLLTVDRRDEVFTDQNNYSDVNKPDWYNKAVSSMTKGEYINGYPDGTFKGGNSITRAEFVTILVRFLDGPRDGDLPFSDVKGHWAEQYITTAVQAGWIDGYPDGTFQPDKEISRAEAMKIINTVLHRGVNEHSELGDYINFPDNSDASKWYYYEIIEAVNSHEAENERPDENWIANKCDYEYDIDKYERP